MVNPYHRHHFGIPRVQSPLAHFSAHHDECTSRYENTVAVGAAPPAAKTKKKPSATPKKGEEKGKLKHHPPVSDMVVAAIETLKERKGSSLQAIKKYIAANYQCDVTKLGTFIRKALRNGVEKGKCVQTKGTGASGSFKLQAVTAGEGKQRRKKPEGAATTKKKKPTGTGSKKAASKRAAAKASGVKKMAATIAKQKATKPSKTAARKLRIPKPKKVPAPARNSTPKKAAAANK